MEAFNGKSMHSAVDKKFVCGKQSFRVKFLFNCPWRCWIRWHSEIWRIAGNLESMCLLWLLPTAFAFGYLPATRFGPAPGLEVQR